ncbi:hypothetical protein [Natronobacterium texcoconense]|uniref:DUF8128 domain-containing protein n=1 Tax=Natronobacterium texcoconense TaxID=1095778 RepID=A0A1H1AM59_NATTX|nr:hypothetical protein [Natronobacterium texcoconense]SDQ40720.1 hypothetical protein SAMN04489842_0740 [Natronobacterium texcoconense]
MGLLKQSHTEVDGEQVEMLRSPSKRFYAVEVKPPRQGDIPETVEEFLRGVLELQTRYRVKNTSPTIGYEIYRTRTDRLQVQFCVPTKRLERKVRTHLSNVIPGIGFDTGFNGLPVLGDDSIGGAILTTGRDDQYPLRTDFDSPPIDSVVGALHRHAMRDTRFVIQILFKPVAGFSVEDWWRKRRGYRTVSHLRKETDLYDRSATPRERKQADLVDRKLGTRRYWTCIRFAVIGAGEYTPSRVKEVAGAFNVFENLGSSQYLDIYTVQGRRQKPFLGFCKAIRDRAFGGYSLRFQTSLQELAGLVSVPNREQKNLQRARP